MGLVHQTLAGENQGLKTMEIWLVTLPPGSETPADQHYGEAGGSQTRGFPGFHGAADKLQHPVRMGFPIENLRHLISVCSQARDAWNDCRRTVCH